MKIAIYGSRRQADYLQPLSEFLDLLSSKGVEVVMHRKLYDVLLPVMPKSLAAVRKVVQGPDFMADVALSIGGDGTFLRTAAWIGNKEIPILGINTGHLGYLSGASIFDYPHVVTELLAGDYQVESRSLIEVMAPALPFWPYALNEVAIAKEETASMITADTTVNRHPLAMYKADGLIVCTPTGSTAYNLSVGGPIIQPTAPVWALSPIAAHSLGIRPLVVDDSSRIDIKVEGRARAFRITIDGRADTLPIGSEITLRKAPFAIKVIVRKGHEFPAALREKLRWSE